ncbi:MAG: hypothetical protein JNM14_09645 [Ferruginibacter sp.]|nr:hypothetical protein [Ferruginibacter sp.]
MPSDIYHIEKTKESSVSEAQAAYEKEDLTLLKDALKRTHMERFLFATSLYKIQQTLKKGTFIHKPYKSF